MGKNNNGTAKYGPVVQLLLIAGALVTPFLAFNLMDLELFSVSKTTFTALFCSIRPWLCPPYVYLLINFIIFFIAASSSFRSSKPIVFNTPMSTDDHQQQSLITDDDAFIPSTLAAESSSYVNLHTVFKDPHHVHADEYEESGRSESNGVVEKKRELRKSKTFHEAAGARVRRERYVRILSEEELNRQVEAFICRCKQQQQQQHANLQKSET